MQKYEGYGGGKVIIDGDNMSIHGSFSKEDCKMSDLVSVFFKDAVRQNRGSITITTKSSRHGHQIVFDPNRKDQFKELYDNLSEKIKINTNPVKTNPEEAPINSFKFCPECGTPCEGMKFCPQCGKVLEGW